MCAKRTRGNYLHLNLIEDLQERVKHLHDVIQKKKFMRKILRAWSTLVEEDELSDGDDHYYHWDGIEMLESMGTKEDLESQKSQIVSLDSPNSTSTNSNELIDQNFGSRGG